MENKNKIKMTVRLLRIVYLDNIKAIDWIKECYY